MEDSTNPNDVPITSKTSIQVEDSEIKENSPVRNENPELFLAEGEIMMTRGEVGKAIELFQKALSIASNLRGDLDQTLYNFYYSYADALIVQHEKDNEGNMFGEAVPQQVACSVSESQNEEGSSEEEGSSNEAEDNKESEENKENEENKEANENKDMVKEQDLEGEGEKDKAEGKKGEESGISESFDPSGDEASEEEDKENKVEGEAEGAAQAEEKEDDLQIAWECLESSRVILNRLETPDYKFLTKVLTRLGNLLSYKEEFEKANDEYQTALNTLGMIESNQPSRWKAELYYLIGNNCLLVKGKELEAVSNFNSALSNLQGYMELTQNIKEKEELVEIINEVKLKIDDAIEQKDSITVLKEMENEDMNKFDQPKIENKEMMDLGVIKRKSQPMNDPECPDSSDNKRRIN